MTLRRLFRFFIAIALTYGVYTEAGVWTALAIFLIFGASEISSFEIKKIQFIVGGIMAMVFKDDFEKEQMPEFITKENEQ